jgi:hypothetical protein
MWGSDRYIAIKQKFIVQMERTTAFWSAIAALLIALSVPWFLWGSSRVVAGFPVWIWWHIGWMALTAVVFWVFSRRAWGTGIEDAETGIDG